MKKELKITSLRSIWTVDLLHGTENDPNPKMIEVREKILKRDQNTCAYCGWKAERFMEIHHKDHNHDNFNENNLETVCPLCHQVFHLPSVGVLKGGEMMWMPELPQHFINNFCINLFLAMELKDTSEMALSFYQEFKKRVEFINQEMGSKNALYSSVSDPSIFAEALIHIQDENDENKEKVLSQIHQNIKILPNLERFKIQINEWIKEKKVNADYFQNVEKVFQKIYSKENLEEKLKN